MAGVMMVDLSAAFDMVNHNILLEKLLLLGLDSKAVSWVESYLSCRSQCVSVDGCLSSLLPITCGVPQGSVLGPLLYILFTNDLPDAIHDQHEESLSYMQPNLHCNPCGSLVNYVDDGIYTYTNQDPVMLSQVLSSKYKSINEYMVTNKLVINADKTHLVVMGSKKMETARHRVELQAGEHIIYPSKTEKLLGCNINQNLKWKTHVQDGESSLTRQLTSRLNALKKVSVYATFVN